MYAKTTDGGQKMLYVEEVLAVARSTVRKSAKAGVDVLKDTSAKENLRVELYEQGYIFHTSKTSHQILLLNQVSQACVQVLRSSHHVTGFTTLRSSRGGSNLQMDS